jgi:mono/diheme cytochrome c family protein
VSKRRGIATLLACGVGLLVTVPSRATVEMEKEARKLGFPAANCLYCHATPHAVQKMKATARELHMTEGNCLLCHGAKIPAKLNDRGQWLVREKDRRKAERAEMKWLEDYVEPKEKGKDDSKATPPRN